LQDRREFFVCISDAADELETPHVLDPVSLMRYVFNRMNPERAFQEQVERYRRMSGEERLALALELHELACNVAREGIRHQHPGADEAEIERLLRYRLELARQ